MTPTPLALVPDPALAELTRAGDTEAFGELWRRHVGAGIMAARQFASIADPQDIASEAYLRILRAVQNGGGPHEAFRPYLYRTIRNIAMDWRARASSVALDETEELLDPSPSPETTVLENAVTAKAFEQLPERWRAVLWYLEVEGMSPTEAAPILGLSPNATSVLAGRAHEGFKKAWLQAHVNDRSVPADCQWTTERMGGYVRRGLTRRSGARFDRHLDECERCALLAHEIGDLGGQLASVVLPVLLGSGAGSLLLGQLRDQAASVTAASIAPLAVPVGSAVLRGAAAVVIASGALLAPAAVEQPPQPPTATEAEVAPNGSPTASGSGPLADLVADTPEPTGAAAAPEVSASAGPVLVETAATPVSTSAPSLVASDVSIGDGAIVDASVSLLAGTVSLDATIDLDPTTGLVVTVLPEVPLLDDVPLLPRLLLVDE